MVDLTLLFYGFGTVLYGYNLVALLLARSSDHHRGDSGAHGDHGIALLVPFTFGMTPSPAS